MIFPDYNCSEISFGTIRFNGGAIWSFQAGTVVAAGTVIYGKGVDAWLSAAEFMLFYKEPEIVLYMPLKPLACLAINNSTPTL